MRVETAQVQHHESQQRAVRHLDTASRLLDVPADDVDVRVADLGRHPVGRGARGRGVLAPPRAGPAARAQAARRPGGRRAPAPRGGDLAPTAGDRAAHGTSGRRHEPRTSRRPGGACRVRPSGGRTGRAGVGGRLRVGRADPRPDRGAGPADRGHDQRAGAARPLPRPARAPHLGDGGRTGRQPGRRRFLSRVRQHRAPVPRHLLERGHQGGRDRCARAARVRRLRTTDGAGPRHHAGHPPPVSAGAQQRSHGHPLAPFGHRGDRGGERVRRGRARVRPAAHRAGRARERGEDRRHRARLAARVARGAHSRAGRSTSAARPVGRRARPPAGGPSRHDHGLRPRGRSPQGRQRARGGPLGADQLRTRRPRARPGHQGGRSCCDRDRVRLADRGAGGPPAQTARPPPERRSSTHVVPPVPAPRPCWPRSR